MNVGREAKEQSLVEFSDTSASLSQASSLKLGFYMSLVEFFSSLFLSLRKHICTPNNTAADGLLGRWWGQIE